MLIFAKGRKRSTAAIALIMLLLCVPLSQAEAPATFTLNPEGMDTELYLREQENLDAQITRSLQERAENDADIYQDQVDGLGFINGMPEQGNIPWHDALGIAVDAIMHQYGLTAEDLDAFTAHLAFNVADPGAPLWQVDLMPTDDSQILELGSYGAHIFAKTGEVQTLYSHEDAVG